MTGDVATANAATVTNDESIEAPDSALVRACLAGDQDAWARVVDKYARLVLSVARQSGLSESDADDVLQTVFLTLFRRLSGLRDHGRLSSWLITTTYRESWRVGKASSRQLGLDENLEATLVDDREPPTELVMRVEREQLVREAMIELDARCRDLLTALFLAGDSVVYAEVADRLAMPIGSIGPTRARCFRKLETLLRARGLDEFE